MQVWPSLTQIEYAWRRWQGPKGDQAGMGWGGAGRGRRQDACAGRSAAVAGPAGAVARLPPTPTSLTPPNADADAAASNADGTNLPPTLLSPPPPAGQRSPTIGIAMVRSRKTSEGDDTARPAMDLDKIIKNLLGVRKKIEKQIGRPAGSASATSLGSSSSAGSSGSRRALRSAPLSTTSQLKQAMAVLQESQARQLCLSARDIFLQQPMLLELEAPVNIVGDIHGQFEDLLRHFDKLGYPPAANYLFLGDYVDRGRNSLEVICLLLAYKLKYPNNFFLLRGNHECASINRVYGFYEECKRRYSIKLWKTFTDLFNCLPVAALVEGTIFCTHGGLSPQLSDLNEIRNIPRPIDVPDSGLVCDLLWSDPAEGVSGWAQNDRGVSFVFGRDVVQRFLQRHGCSLIVRAHQVVEDGYQFFAERSLLTLFSAPNYCGEFDNAGAVLGVSEDLTCWFSVLPPVKKKMFVRYK